MSKERSRHSNRRLGQAHQHHLAETTGRNMHHHGSPRRLVVAEEFSEGTDSISFWKPERVTRAKKAGLLAELSLLDLFLTYGATHLNEVFGTGINELNTAAQGNFGEGNFFGLAEQRMGLTCLFLGMSLVLSEAKGPRARFVGNGALNAATVTTAVVVGWNLVNIGLAIVAK